MIVVDTNVLLYLFVGGPGTAAAERLAREDAEWHAPLLWRSEFCNALIGYVRRGTLPAPSADAVWSAARRQMARREHLVNGDRVLSLAQGCRCTAYDLEFVALAEGLNAPLVTNDWEILRAFPRRAQPLAAYA